MGLIDSANRGNGFLMFRQGWWRFGLCFCTVRDPLVWLAEHQLRRPTDG